MRSPVAVLACVCALPAPAMATVLFDWDLAELTRRADRIVIGVVESQRTERVGNTLMTDTTLRVDRTLTGTVAATITVRQLGGRLGDRIVDVPGDAVLRTGARYLLFTAQPPGGAHRYLVGMALGALEFKDGALAQTIDVPLLSRGGGLRDGPGLRRVELPAVERAITAQARP